MPVLQRSSYKSPLFFSSGHLQTIFPSLFRPVQGIHYHRQRIETPDDDFLDLDWSKVGSKHIAIVSHGLEGSSCRSYMLGMVKSLNKAGWDALAWNYRGCNDFSKCFMKKSGRRWK
jgi:predicted alpha/beta-fold hydrolase